MDHKLKLMVVDDSPLFRTWLIRSLSEDDRFQVVGYAINAFDAQEKIPKLQPDMLTLDIEMPGMSGIDFLKQLLPVHPIPVILVSSLNLRVFDASVVLDTLRSLTFNSSAVIFCCSTVIALVESALAPIKNVSGVSFFAGFKGVSPLNAVVVAIRVTLKLL